MILDEPYFEVCDDLILHHVHDDDVVDGGVYVVSYMMMLATGLEQKIVGYLSSTEFFSSSMY